MSPPASSFFFASSSALRTSSRRDCRTRSAAARFWICDFSFCIDTTMPVGRWVMRTAESVVLTDCPPGGPDERNTSTLISDSGGISMLSSLCSMSGMTSTAANDVCRRPWLSNGGEMRTSRCVPASTDRCPNAYGAFTSKVADFRPASSA